MKVESEREVVAQPPVDAPMASLPWQPGARRVGDDMWLGSPDEPGIVLGQVARVEADRVSMSVRTAQPLAVGGFVLLDAQYVARVVGSSRTKVQLAVLPPEDGQAVLAAWLLARQQSAEAARTTA